MLNKTEILAPAGSMESLVSAVAAGAHAVYVGGDLFSARAFAGNFDTKELIKAIDYCHIHHVRLYMAVNTLLKNSEIAELCNYINPFYLEGLDGVIVQDMGVIKVLKEAFPDLPLHGSTQLSISSSYGAKFMKQMGLTRIVPARELSLQEIKSIKSKVDIELETFVHGAMCFAYSGKCLMSSFAGGRSGNRGKCAQPCRKCYSSDCFNKKYALSMKDMCLLHNLPELISAGIDSFKIEGRMKKPEYVYASVSAYREVQEAFISGCPSTELDNLIACHTDRLLDIYNRGGFSSGYYYISNGHDMLADKRPNHNGLLVGAVKKIKEPNIEIAVSKEIAKGDVLEIRSKKGDIELTSNITGVPGQTVSLKGHDIKKIAIGDSVYRTRNNIMLTEISENMSNEPELTANAVITAKPGYPLKAAVTDEATGVTAVVYGSEVSNANNTPVSPEDIENKFSKTGGMGIRYNIKIDASDNIFIRMSELNSLKRESIAALKNNIINSYTRTNEKAISDHNKNVSYVAYALDGFTCHVETKAQLNIINKYKFVDNVIIDYNVFKGGNLSLSEGKNYLVAFPQIVRENRAEVWESLYNDIITSSYIKGVMIYSIDALGMLCQKNYQGIVICDSYLYSYNKEALSQYCKYIKKPVFMASAELAVDELQELSDSCGISMLRTAYGYQPLMITAQCFLKNYKKCMHRETVDNQYITKLHDDMGNVFYGLSKCTGCYNIIYNGIPTYIEQYLSDYINDRSSQIVFSFSLEKESETMNIMNDVEKALEKNDASGILTVATKGHYKRGID